MAIFKYEYLHHVNPIIGDNIAKKVGKHVVAHIHVVPLKRC